MSTAQSTEEQFSYVPVSILLRCERFLERLTAYWPIDGRGEVTVSHVAHARTLDSLQDLLEVLRESDPPEFLDVPGFTAPVRDALREVRESVEPLQKRISNPSKEPLPALDFDSLLKAAGQLRSVLQRHKRVAPIRELPTNIQSVQPGIWKRWPKSRDLTTSLAMNLAADGRRDRTLRLYLRDKYENKPITTSTGLEPSATVIRHFWQQAAELSELLDGLCRNSDRRTLFGGDFESLRRILKHCWIIGRSMGWEAPVHVRGKRSAAQERRNAVAERLERLKSQNAWPVQGWPQPADLREAIGSIGCAITDILASLHCEEVCIGQNIAWLVVGKLEEHPIDPSRGTSTHFAAWSPDALDAIADGCNPLRWTELLLDEELFLWPELDKQANALRDAERMLRVQLDTVHKAAAPSNRPGGRPAYERDHLWLRWYESAGEKTEGSPSKILDRWNAMPDTERSNTCASDPAPLASAKGERTRSCDIIKKAIDRARRERKTQKPR